MPKFGTTSLKNRAELHPDLQKIADIAIQHWDCSIIDGKRTKEEQEKYIARGVSQTMDSRHLPRNAKGEIDWNDGVAFAMDIMAHPIDWKAIERGIAAVRKVDPGQQTLEAYAFHGFLLGIAAALNIPVRSGIDWDDDQEFSDHSFIDLPHIEKVIP